MWCLLYYQDLCLKIDTKPVQHFVLHIHHLHAHVTPLSNHGPDHYFALKSLNGHIGFVLCLACQNLGEKNFVMG